MTRRSWWLFWAMCVIWGVPYLLIRVAVRDVSPATLVFARTAIGGLVLLPIALRNGGFGAVLRRWRPLGAFIVVELAIPWLLLSEAETRLSSSLCGLLVAAVPLVGVLVAKAMGERDRIEPMRVLGLLMGIGGVAALVGLDLSQLDLGAVLEIGVVVVGYALGPAIQARYLSDLANIPVIAASLLIVAVVYLPFAIAQRPHHLSAQSAAAIIGLGLICTALAFVVFFALITEIGAARAVVVTYVNPAVAVALGIGLLGEQVTVGMLVGFPLILAGSVLAARRTLVVEAAAP